MESRTEKATLPNPPSQQNPTENNPSKPPQTPQETPTDPKTLQHSTAYSSNKIEPENGNDDTDNLNKNSSEDFSAVSDFIQKNVDKIVQFQYQNCKTVDEVKAKMAEKEAHEAERKKIEKFARENNIPSVETYNFDTFDEFKAAWKKKSANKMRDLIKSAQIPKIFSVVRATDFKVTDKNRETAQTAIKCITENSGLYLYGECGTGKTMLASIIANERAEHLKSSMFIGAVDIFHELNPFSSDSRTAHNRKDIIKNTPCLIIDDLGAEKPSDWTKQTLFEIIDFRYRENLQTIITSNFNINELKSRLSDYEGNRIIRRIKAICKLTELNHF